MSEGISVEYLEQSIRTRLEATHVEIIDTSGEFLSTISFKPSSTD